MSTYTLHKEIPAVRQVDYTNIGWSADHSGERVCVSRSITTGGSVDEHDTLKLGNPYLVQRGLIRRPLGKHTDATLTQAVKLDYMGAAEFEYGELPKSLRRIESQFMLYKRVIAKNIVATINGRDFDLRLLANFDTQAEEDEYLSNLLKAFQGTLYTLESFDAKVADGKVLITDRTDFWWDIRNDVLFSFDKQFMSRIQNHLQISFSTMNALLKN